MPPIQPIAKAAPASSRIRQGLVREKCIMNVQVSNDEDTMVLAATLPSALVLTSRGVLQLCALQLINQCEKCIRYNYNYDYF